MAKDRHYSFSTAPAGRGPANQRDLERGNLTLLRPNSRELVQLHEALCEALDDAQADQLALRLASEGGPALWIDRSARFEPGDDLGAIRFLLDTRSGWQVLMESDQIALLVDLARRYMQARSTSCAMLEMLLRPRP